MLYLYCLRIFLQQEKNNFDYKFFRVNTNITHSIKRKADLSLLETKLKDILINKISSKYSTVDENHNKDLIQKIYQNKTGTNIIIILELTFR